MKRYARAVVLALSIPCATAADADAFDWELPPWLGPPTVPVDNPMTRAKVDLGGSRSPLTSPLIRGFRLTGTEQADLIAFLESLTDRTFAQDPHHHTSFR